MTFIMFYKLWIEYSFILEVSKYLRVWYNQNKSHCDTTDYIHVT